jgi:hypothetical protein
MVISTVDEDHLGVAMSKRLGCRNSGESAADDHDTRRLGRAIR